jgi:hypothetical protein
MPFLPPPRPVLAPAAAVPKTTAAPLPEEDNRSHTATLWAAVILGSLLLTLLATAGLVLHFSRKPAQQVADSQPPEQPPTASASERPAVDEPPPSPMVQPHVVPEPPAPVPVPVPSREPDPPRPPVRPPPPDLARAPETPGALLPAAEQEDVNKAIDRGVRFLLNGQTAGGTWPGHDTFVTAMAALPALTLLECGVAADDKHIQNAARFVRSNVPKLQSTYEIALSILFLDRLGDPRDETILQTLGVRLLAGQAPAGGWTYVCPILQSKQEHDLLTALRAQGSGSASAKDGPRPTSQETRRALEALPRKLRDLPSLRDPAMAYPLDWEPSDNSNTQFAALAVWVASRHGVPTERALGHIARRFRDSQRDDGGWGYTYGRPSGEGSDAMTGAGLLGLAVGLGLVVPEKDRDAQRTPPRDPAVERGFAHLAQSLGKPLGPRALGRGSGRASVNLYFLWTLERVGVLYNLREIEGKDWYHWGAELLVDSQGSDGSWAVGGYHGSMPNIDTSFALLFLKRANLAQDLSKRLEFAIDLKESKGSK